VVVGTSVVGTSVVVIVVTGAVVIGGKVAFVAGGSVLTDVTQLAWQPARMATLAEKSTEH